MTLEILLGDEQRVKLVRGFAKAGMIRRLGLVKASLSSPPVRY